MAGVWVFKNGVVRLVENGGAAAGIGCDGRPSVSCPRKALVDLATNEVISSQAALERKLVALGWERYYEDPELLQFHKRSCIDLISLPKDFTHFKSIHMYDIVVKNRDAFRVIDR